jgi:molecular chaperone GrpE
MENKDKKHKNKKNEELKKEECKCSCDEECSCNEECNCNEKCSCDEKIEDNNLDKIKKLEDALLRSQAELVNYKRRKDEETSRIIKYAEEDILKGFLPILDNFERAINMDDDNLDDEVSKFLLGFKLMYKQIKDLLAKFEVKEMDPLNKPFDPAYHQAIAVDNKEGILPGTVTEVLQKGYMYKDKVLRTAMVKVSE